MARWKCGMVGVLLERRPDGQMEVVGVLLGRRSDGQIEVVGVLLGRKQLRVESLLYFSMKFMHKSKGCMK